MTCISSLTSSIAKGPEHDGCRSLANLKDCFGRKT